MKAALIGSVKSSLAAVEEILTSPLDLVGICGHTPTVTANVSSYVDLCSAARVRGVNAVPFRRINEPAVETALRSWDIDFLFVIGLSQLVPKRMLAIPRRLALGFHPTPLPIGRGRSPIAWLAESGGPGAATLFELTEEADAGAVVAQVPFTVEPLDHADDIERSAIDAMRVALRSLLPALARDQWSRVSQNELNATNWGKRDEFDGLVDWDRPARDVARRIQAASWPHPGAYCYWRGERIRLGRVLSVHQDDDFGIPGKVVHVDEATVTVRCSDGSVCLGSPTSWLRPTEAVQLRVGHRMFLRVQDELHELSAQLAEVRARLL